MRLPTISWAVVATATTLFCLLNALPVPEDGSSLDTYSPQDVELTPEVHSSVEDTRPKLHLTALQKRAIVERLEGEMLAAASVGAAAEAVRLEQRLEDAILKDAVSTIGNKALNREEKAARLVELANAVQRDKRAVEALSGLLGASSGGGNSGAPDASVGASITVGGGSNPFSLLPTLLGSSSGGNSGGDGGDGGGGSNLLSLLPTLLGSSSGGGGGDDSGSGGGGGSNLLSFLPSLLGVSSGGGGGGGGDDNASGGGGGSNLLSLLPTLLGVSSGGGGAGGSVDVGGLLSPNGGSGGTASSLGGSIFGTKTSWLGNPVIPAGATYDELIGRGGGQGDVIGWLTGSVSKLLEFKFRIFKNLFSSLVSGFLGNLGGLSGGGGGASATASASTS